MNSAIYQGHVSHQRHTPRPHAFRYPIYMVYLDLDELDDVFASHPLWSLERFNLLTFRRKDYFGAPTKSLHTELATFIEQRTGRRPGGPVRMLTNLAVMGYCFNPVTFYYAYDAGNMLDSIVAEVTNTPWGERHAYLLDVRNAQQRGRTYGWSLDKEFHVSPFFDMDQKYRWRFNEPGDALTVSMKSFEDRAQVFDASLSLKRQPLTAASINRVLLRHPAMSIGVHAAIYFQAFRLWLKRTPFFTHPAKRPALSRIT